MSDTGDTLPDGEGEDVYRSSSIKRVRATKVEVTRRREALVEIVAKGQPMTVRQTFYQASSVHKLFEKTEDGYRKVQNDLTLLRRAGIVPYGWITDSTRWQRKPRSHRGLAHLLRETAKLYRRDLWAEADCYVEIWIEKDALTGSIYPVTSEYDVPLMSARGYSSLSFLWEAAEYMNSLEVPSYVYHFGDYDPSGQNAALKIEETLREMAPNAAIHFERAAVTPWHIEAWNLPTRPTKKSDPRAAKFGNEDSVELDAIPPQTLRQIVRSRIERHIAEDQLEILRAAEESERNWLAALAKRFEEQA